MSLHKANITRREALRLGTGTILGGATAVAGAGIAQNAVNPSRVREYAWVRGFNYQPSWGGHGITVWNNFQEKVFAREVDQGLRHFPKLNALRIWFSYDAHMADSKKFLAAAKRASALLAERKIKMIPVIFNGWHSLVDFGGFSLEQLLHSRGNNRFGAHRQYLRELIGAIRPADSLLMYDLERAVQQRRQREGQYRGRIPRNHGGRSPPAGYGDARFGRHAGVPGGRRARRPRPD